MFWKKKFKSIDDRIKELSYELQERDNAIKSVIDTLSKDITSSFADVIKDEQSDIDQVKKKIAKLSANTNSMIEAITERIDILYKIADNNQEETISNMADMNERFEEVNNLIIDVTNKADALIETHRNVKAFLREYEKRQK